MAYKIFIDTNVYLDVLMHRGNGWPDAESLLLLAEQKHLHAYTSASSLLNLIYVLHAEKITKAEIVQHSNAILRFCTLANPDNTTFGLALASSFSDLEDAVQYFTALHIPGIDYFVTSNTRDFRKALATLPVVTPKTFMQIWSSALKK